MSAQAKIVLSEEDFIAFEKQSVIKHEYFRGEIFAMAGTTFEHGLISGNLVAGIHGFLKGKPCVVQASEIKTHIYQNSLFTYPDISVICGKPIFAYNQNDIITNPKVIIEILSPSTEHYDRTTKFALYTQIPSLEEYILVHQDKPKTESFIKNEAGMWSESIDIVGIEKTFKIICLDFELAMKEVYQNIEFID